MARISTAALVAGLALVGGGAAQQTQARPAPRTDFDAPAGPPARPAAETAEGAARPADARGVRSPLLDVFRAVGTPEDLRALKGVIVRYRLRVLDPRGAEVAVRELYHEADLAAPDRDRLLFTGTDRIPGADAVPRPAAGSGGRIYGRDGGAAWATQHGIGLPSLERQAAEELQLFGWLLRAPWCFADAARFTVFPPEPCTEPGTGRNLVRVRVEARDPAEAERIGPDPRAKDGDRFEVLCVPETCEPVGLRYRVGPLGEWRTLRLLDPRRFLGVQMPTRRVVLFPDGTPALEIQTVHLDLRQDLPRTQFQPPKR